MSYCWRTPWRLWGGCSSVEGRAVGPLPAPPAVSRWPSNPWRDHLSLRKRSAWPAPPFPTATPSRPRREARGPIVQDEDGAAVCPLGGPPGLPPGRRARVTLLPVREPLAARQAAEAVRARGDGQAPLGLALTDPGVEWSALRELRPRGRAGRAAAP